LKCKPIGTDHGRDTTPFAQKFLPGFLLPHATAEGRSRKVDLYRLMTEILDRHRPVTVAFDLRPELKLKYSDSHSAGRGWDRPCRFGGLRDVRRRSQAAVPLAALGPVRRRDADPVAATPAAALADYNTTNAAGERLIGEPVLNAVVVLPAITSVLAPILAERYARQ
jgi:hypothetical protein